jgi:hypothetical protein
MHDVGIKKTGTSLWQTWSTGLYNDPVKDDFSICLAINMGIKVRK